MVKISVYLSYFLHKIFLATIPLIVFLLYIGYTSADTIYVDDGGGGDFTSIQEAIDSANESDIISVSGGTYNGAIIINKSVTIEGEVRSNTIISASGINTIKIQANNVSISGFTIENSLGSSFACIQFYNVINCDIRDIHAKYGGNIIYFIGSNNNIIQESILENGNIGIFLSNSNNNIIKENSIQNNNAYGISLSSTSSNNTIYKNDFSDNLANNARDLNTGASNHWYYQQKGNYWDDYNEYDIDNNGIGDLPYVINVNSQDLFPLGDFLSYNQKPVAYIDSVSPNSANIGQPVSIHGHGTDDGFIVAWEWKSSKEGVIGNSADISLDSLMVGTHIISFRVQDNEGQWSNYKTESLNIINPSTEINQPPEASIVTIDPSDSIEGESIYFHGYGIDTDGLVTGYSWRSNRDGLLSSSSSFNSNTLSVGTHIVYFKVKDNDGDWSTEVSTQISVEENHTVEVVPVVIIECPLEGKINQTLRFDASKSNSPGDSDAILSYFWDFGDGKSGSGQIITHSYLSSGNYTVILRIEDTMLHSSSNNVVVSIANISYGTNPVNTSSEQNDKVEYNTPGFEFAVLLCSISVFLFINLRRKW